jgi:regulation of enolase protein 1 (concanavalin A-like superfamily)
MKYRPLSLRSSIVSAVLLGLSLVPAAALAQTDQMYFPAYQNVTSVLVQKINAENVRIDMSAWYLTERSVSIALVNRFKAGVEVRLIGDRGSIFEIDQHTKNEFYWLASQGVPIRLRVNPTWFPEIAHWKATIFVGQNLVEFGSANYTPFQLAPVSSTNYADETAFFTSDQALVNAFKTRFDQIWNDTTRETGSRISGPPYMKNWDAACAAEAACADYKTRYPNPVPMVVDTSRLEPDYPTPADLIWSQGSAFNNRLVQEINNESTKIDFVIYRLTVSNITDALLSRYRAGVPMRLIIEPNEYMNRKWPEFWLTHAYVDRLWAAGVPIKQRKHDGITHMKSLITSDYATSASSNFAANWQRDHNYFIPAATKPTIHQAMVNRFQAMWTDTAGFTDFVPVPADRPTLASPASAATGVSTTPKLTWNAAPFATSYDVYLGTAAGSLSLVGNVPAQLVDNPPSTYSWTAGTALGGGTTYYWQVVARTNATVRNPSLVTPSATWYFTTTGSGGPPPPPPPSSLPAPWQTQDVGSVGQTGSASYSNGVFTVAGAGADIWGSADGFRYVYQSLSGDGTITARLTAMQNTNTYAKAGVMLRESLAANAAHVMLDARPNGGIEFMKRATTGGATSYLAGATQPAPAWLRLSRSGSTVTASVSADGSTWTAVGTTAVTFGSTAYVGILVCSHTTTALNTSTFDNVTVSGDTAPPPPPPPAGAEVVIYASDIPATGLNGAWQAVSATGSPNGVKLVTADSGYASTNAPLASPVHYVDVTFNADAGVPYRLWLRLQATANSKYNDAVWVQFSDARVNGSPAYPLNSTSGLLVNLATDGTASSLNGWGWQNGAYWLSQSTLFTFATSGSHTMRIQVREDGVQLDQIVLSPSKYLNTPPGPTGGDSTIVVK